jgi:hypothetical protein
MEVIRQRAEIAACRFLVMSTPGMAFSVSKRPASAPMLCSWIGLPLLRHGARSKCRGVIGLVHHVVGRGCAWRRRADNSGHARNEFVGRGLDGCGGD